MFIKKISPEVAKSSGLLERLRNLIAEEIDDSI